jgi:hypothetical protein
MFFYATSLYSHIYTEHLVSGDKMVTSKAQLDWSFNNKIMSPNQVGETLLSFTIYSSVSGVWSQCFWILMSHQPQDQAK